MDREAGRVSGESREEDAAARREDEKAVGGLEETLGYTFTDRTLAATALAHPSYAHEVDGGIRVRFSPREGVCRG